MSVNETKIPNAYLFIRFRNFFFNSSLYIRKIGNNLDRKKKWDTIKVRLFKIKKLTFLGLWEVLILRSYKISKVTKFN
jgi:transcription initiation factor TFIID subunit TAF12